MSDEKIQRYHSDAAPAAIGPYSQAVSVAGMLYTSGQTGIDPATRALASDGFEAQAEQVFSNLRHVLESAGIGFSDVVKATVYLADMADFPVLNRIYARVFGEHRPARSTVQAAALPMGGRVEIDLIARLR
ncbi:MAG: Rid family detoxifying hydrolase [Thermoanaerobaculia bacterium]